MSDQYGNNGFQPDDFQGNGFQNNGFQNGGYQGGGYGGNGNEPGKTQAIVSLVLGIIGVICWFFGYSAIISVILGIIGLILAGNSQKAGYYGGIRTAGFVLSLISLIGGAIFFVACIACLGIAGSTLAAMSGY